MSDLESKDKLAAVIAEYNSLRAEISARSRDQLLCVTASLLSVGALLSTVATDPGKFAGLLVVAPCLLLVLGIMWCDHAHAIHLIALYLRQEIEGKSIPALCGKDLRRYLGWETWLQERRDSSPFLGYINTILPYLYFGLPSLVVVIAYLLVRMRSRTALPEELEIAFIGLSAVLFVTLVFSWRRARPLV